MKKYIVTILIIIAFSACRTAEPVVLEPEMVFTEEPPPEPFESLIEMVYIRGGSFTMGSPPRTAFSLDIERPVRQITLRSFYLGKYEVTQGQYYDVMDMRPSHFIANPLDESEDSWRNLPVEMVNWYDTLVFCNKLSIIEGLEPVYRINGSVNPDDWGIIPITGNAEWDAVEKASEANGFRLPTEAEWEYAARGGAYSGRFTFAGSNTLDPVSWFFDNSDYRIHQVGLKAPNELGLHDMSGNAMEWCWDWLGNYTAANQDNPIGPPSGLYRILRGGAWSVSHHFNRVAYRHSNIPNFTAVNIGFRVARNRDYI